MKSYRIFQDEMFFAAVAPSADSFEKEFDGLTVLYRAALREAGFSEDDEYLLRFHLSDVNTQLPVLRARLGERAAFVSAVGQPPAGDRRIALEVWLRKGLKKKWLRTGAETAFQFGDDRYRWILFRRETLRSSGSYDQMAEEFHALGALLADAGASVASHTARTWIYCRDVDNNYAGLVRARREYFNRIGLTAATHYIASTGIEGQSAPPNRLTLMDSLSGPDLQPEQFEYMHAETHLSPTHVYGVTFERGCRVIFGDRSHYFISGTASIDREGKVLHEGDVTGQAERMVVNVEKLLTNHGAALSDLRFGCVYLRDCADAEPVQQFLASRLPDLPLIYLRAPVCRPQWLVEMEAFAVNDRGDAAFAAL